MRQGLAAVPRNRKNNIFTYTKTCEAWRSRVFVLVNVVFGGRSTAKDPHAALILSIKNKRVAVVVKRKMLSRLKHLTQG